MRYAKRFPVELFLILICVLTIGGCGTSEKTKFYILQPVVGPPLPASSAGEIVVGVGPVKLPEYLTRSQIVTRPGRNSLNLDEFNRWAEPLDQNFARVLAEDLASQLGTNRVAMYPWERSAGVQYQAKVDVARFEGEAGGRAVLEARWIVLKGGTEITARHTVIEKTLADGSYETLVAAESQAVSDLGAEIADAIRMDSHLPR